LLETMFLVDTGADASVLSPADAMALGIHGEVTPQRVHVGGVTGRAQYHQERANVAFRTRGRVHIYRLRVLVAPPTADLAELPSLLGRDVLNRWHMTYRPTEGRLTFDIVTADEEVRLK
jgi:predicted aspartyl protease